MRYSVHLHQILGLIIVIFNLVHKRSGFCRGAQHAPSRFKRGWIALLLGDSKKILASGHRVGHLPLCLTTDRCISSSLKRKIQLS